MPTGDSKAGRLFFVICPPGFELQVAAEIRAAWPHLLGKDARAQGGEPMGLRILKGGVEFQAEIFVGFQVNFFLKTAARVLLRLAEFKARDFPKLHEKIRRLPWREYFQSSALEYVVAARQSRLNHEGRIEETFVKTLAEILPPGSGQIEGRVYVRAEQDLFTVSLDTSGEHLHKRGWAALKGEAPLRENIAAFLLNELIQSLPGQDFSAFTLLDPMAGSGTFLLEARSLFSPNWFRAFAFQNFRCAPKLFQSPGFHMNYRLAPSMSFKAYRAWDRDPRMKEVGTQNWAHLETSLARARKDFIPADFRYETRDLFLNPGTEAAPLCILSNPPYGERLADSADGDIAAYFKALAALRPTRLALLHPEKFRLARTGIPAGYRIRTQIPLLNGGLKTLWTLLEPASL